MKDTSTIQQGTDSKSTSAAPRRRRRQPSKPKAASNQLRPASVFSLKFIEGKAAREAFERPSFNPKEYGLVRDPEVIKAERIKERERRRKLGLEVGVMPDQPWPDRKAEREAANKAKRKAAREARKAGLVVIDPKAPIKPKRKKSKAKSARKSDKEVGQFSMIG